MDNALKDRLDLLSRSVQVLLQWAETHPLTQWEQAGTLSALRLELEDAMEIDTPHEISSKRVSGVRT